jgi:hypothetical protein
MLLRDNTTMNMLRAKYEAWTQQRRARFIKSWTLTRGKGKKRFLALWTISLTVAYLATDCLRELWNNNFDIEGLLRRLVVYLVVNMIVAAIVWRESERACRRYLNAQPQSEQSISTRESNQVG